jgi:hypothetical protein
VSEAPAGFQFVPKGEVRLEPGHPCPGCPHAPGYIIGNVFDAAGRPLCGARVLCYNDWHRYPVVGTKGGGEYDIPVIQAATVWKVLVVDELDQPLSPEAEVSFDPLVGCWYRVDWQQVN